MAPGNWRWPAPEPQAMGVPTQRAACPAAVDTEGSSSQGRRSLEALRARAPGTSQISAKEPGQQAVRKLGRVLIETLDFDESANAQLKHVRIFPTSSTCNLNK